MKRKPAYMDKPFNSPRVTKKIKKNPLPKTYMQMMHEKKFFDTTKGATTVDVTGTILSPSLNLVPQGVTESTRVGRTMYIKNVNVNGDLTVPGGTTNAQVIDRVKLYIFLDTQCNGAAATVTDILETAAINSYRNLAQEKRFVILKKLKLAINQVGGAYNGVNDEWSGAIYPWAWAGSYYIPIEFNSTTGAITEIRSNNVGVMAISKNGNCSLAYTARIRYTDY